MPKENLILSYDDIVGGDAKFEQIDVLVKDKAEKWDIYVESGRKLLETGEHYQMAMAELAIRSCLIIWGGDRRSFDFTHGKQKVTLRKFSQETGWGYKKLQEYVGIKLRVYDHLPAEEKRKMKIYDARRASWKIGTEFRGIIRKPSRKEVLEIYEEATGTGHECHIKKRDAADAIYYLNKAVNLLVRNKMYYEMSDEQRQRVGSLVAEILGVRNSYETIKSVGEKYKGRTILRKPFTPSLRPER